LLSTAGQLLENQTTSMRAAFDQSWNRLTAEEQRLFRQVAVFKGGFDRQSAGAVCGATLGLLASLVDKSFLLGSPEGRYNLHDLLHQYGLEKLSAAGETERVNQRHFEYFLRTAEQNEANLQGGNSFKAFFWLVKEQPNLNAAFEWASAGAPPRDEIGARRLAECMHPELHKAGVHVKDTWVYKKPGK
jgi:predicted ATPase